MLTQAMIDTAVAQRFTLTFSESLSLCVAREPCFAQTARGPGPLGKMFSVSLAIANAVQFSVCSGVLRVLGLAQASPSGVASKGFCNRAFLGSDWALRELCELGGVGNAVRRREEAVELLAVHLERCQRSAATGRVLAACFKMHLTIT